jgi:hypothetical protein
MRTVVSMDTDQGPPTNSLGDVEPEPQQTDNGPKPGDAEVDQHAVTLPDSGELESGSLAQTVLATALGHRGTVEQPVGSNRQRFGAAYGWNGVAWCNIFVSRVGFEASGSYDLLGKFASTVACATWWRQQGRFGTEPVPGAAVFFDWGGGDGIGQVDHIGLVVQPLPGGRVRTIEGNAAIPGHPDGVWVHDRASKFIVGYGYPTYASAPAPKQVTIAVDKVPRLPGLMKRGSRGPGVVALQRRLVDRGWHLDVDGDFGPATDKVVRRYQREKGLEVDGEVGQLTWTSLWTAPVT